MTLTAEDIVRLLDFPRDNASEGLAQGYAVLDSLLHQAQVTPLADTFASSPHRLTVAGFCLLLTVVGLLWAGLQRHAIPRVLTLLGILLATVFASGGFDALLPHTQATNLLADIAPAGRAQQTILLAAHYDSKSEPFDHVSRSIVLLLACITVLAAVWMQWRQRQRRRRLLLAVPATVCVVLLVVQFLGSGLGGRSHGIRDNAAACALLVELCSRAAHRPLENSRLLFAWWAAEEIGAQGSSSWSQRHVGRLPDVVVNLEAIGGGNTLAVATREWTGRGWRSPGTQLVERLRQHAPLREMGAPLLSDAGPFLGLGVDTVTLLNLPAGARWPRGLHGSSDDLDALQMDGVAATRDLLLALLRDLDAQPLTDSHAP